jgi:hypothetical protein
MIPTRATDIYDMNPTLKHQFGLWSTTHPNRIAVTRSASSCDPKGVEGHVVKGDDGKWRIDRNNREFDSLMSAAGALIASLPGN